MFALAKFVKYGLHTEITEGLVQSHLSTAHIVSHIVVVKNKSTSLARSVLLSTAISVIELLWTTLMTNIVVDNSPNHSEPLSIFQTEWNDVSSILTFFLSTRYSICLKSTGSENYGKPLKTIKNI